MLLQCVALRALEAPDAENRLDRSRPATFTTEMKLPQDARQAGECVATSRSTRRGESQKRQRRRRHRQQREAEEIDWTRRFDAAIEMRGVVTRQETLVP